jgi:hypothetical protein
MARVLRVSASKKPGVMILGGSPWAVDLGKAIAKTDLPVILCDPNHAHLRSAREAGLPVYYGDVLSENAEHQLDFVAYEALICATDDDAYNTLVATDLGAEFGRQNTFQIKRVRDGAERHNLPSTLGGQALASNETFFEGNARMAQGGRFGVSTLTSEFTLADWRAAHPDAVAMIDVTAQGGFRVLGPQDAPRDSEGLRIIHLSPPSA